MPNFSQINESDDKVCAVVSKGANIGSVCDAAVGIAKAQQKPVFFTFNRVLLTANPDSVPFHLVDHFLKSSSLMYATHETGVFEELSNYRSQIEQLVFVLGQAVGLLSRYAPPEELKPLHDETAKMLDGGTEQ